MRCEAYAPLALHPRRRVFNASRTFAEVVRERADATEVARF